MMPVALFIKKLLKQNPCGMNKNKPWLLIKLVLILILTGVIFIMPTEDKFKKWLRFSMLVVFVVSFIMDVINYKKNND